MLYVPGNLVTGLTGQSASFSLINLSDDDSRENEGPLWTAYDTGLVCAVAVEAHGKACARERVKHDGQWLFVAWGGWTSHANIGWLPATRVELIA